MQNADASGIVIFVGLVEVIGATVAMGIARKLENCTTINNRWKDRLFWTALVVILLSAIISIIYPIYLSKTKSGPSSYLSESNIISFYVFIDLLALSIYIYATGGSRQSLYTPYLFLIVPMTVILHESLLRVFFYVVGSFIVFWAFLRMRESTFKIEEAARYDKYFAIITILCVFFPAGFEPFLYIYKIIMMANN